MSNTLVHDVSVWSPYAQETHQAKCVCGWVGELRASLTVARIDAKHHRLGTVADDDTNTKKPRVRKGTIAEVAAEGTGK